MTETWRSEYHMELRSMVNNYDAAVPKMCDGRTAHRMLRHVRRGVIWDGMTDESHELDLVAAFDEALVSLGGSNRDV